MYRDFLHGLGHLIFNLSFDITSPRVLHTSVTVFIHWPERSVGLSAGLKWHLLSLYRSLIEHDGIALTHYMWVKPWRKGDGVGSMEICMHSSNRALENRT